MRVLWMMAVAAALGACSRPAEVREDFEREELGPNWHSTGGPYRIVEGKLRVAGAKNRPLWYRSPLPKNAEIELTATSHSPSGDIKFELYGDGRSRAEADAYVASGYVLIFGGWHNRKSMIARKDEHGPQSVARFDVKVEPGRPYRFKVVRKEGELRWFIDGELFLTYRDPDPLYGPDNRYLALNNWESDLVFDDLVIRRMPR